MTLVRVFGNGSRWKTNDADLGGCMFKWLTCDPQFVSGPLDLDRGTDLKVAGLEEETE